MQVRLMYNTPQSVIVLHIFLTSEAFKKPGQDSSALWDGLSLSLSLCVCVSVCVCNLRLNPSINSKDFKEANVKHRMCACVGRK
jgi:hypothetical protein